MKYIINSQMKSHIMGILSIMWLVFTLMSAVPQINYNIKLNVFFNFCLAKKALY